MLFLFHVTERNVTLVRSVAARGLLRPFYVREGVSPLSGCPGVLVRRYGTHTLKVE
ncbi:hypothetical protein J6590_006406 [Homalodisca vitripennis]|nr:hypothetical protein J6590_006406 [Homalodisca vitripennis]